MTNTHINVGGHKITTNKVGQVHTVTSGFQNSFTGTLYWGVTNGVCTLYFDGNAPNTSNNNRIIYSGVPKAKVSVLTPTYGSVAYAYVGTSGNVGLYKNNDGTYILFSLTYVVSDDWVES